MQTEESSAKEKMFLSLSDRIKTLYVNAKKKCTRSTGLGYLFMVEIQHAKLLNLIFL